MRSAVHLRPGDEGSPAYQQIARTIYTARANHTHIINAYIITVRNGSLVFLVDDLSGMDPDFARIGESYETTDLTIITRAFSSPAVSDTIYTDKWGSFLSGYAPVRGRNGTAVAVLGVDMSSDFVITFENFGIYRVFDYF